MQPRVAPRRCAVRAVRALLAPRTFARSGGSALGEFYTGPLYHLLGLSPILLAEIIGLIVAFVLVRKHAKAAVIVIVVTIANLLLQVSWPFLVELFYRQTFIEGRFGPTNVLGIAGTARSIIHAICWVLLIVAVFIGRGGAPRADGTLAPGRAPTPLHHTHRTRESP